MKNEETEIPTAEEFFKFENIKPKITGKGAISPVKAFEELAIEFVKLHVQKALEEVVKKAIVYHFSDGAHGCEYYVDEKSILNAYPLENIK